MLEIIALVFLTRKIGDIAETKGLKKGMWKLYTVLAWFGLEIVVMVAVLAMLGEDQIIVGALCGLLAGFCGYLLIKYNLEQKPDAENEIDELASHLDQN